MPQDELWAASARSIGLRVELMTHAGPSRDQAWLTATPLWSKTPSSRNGYVSVQVPTYAIWEVPHIFNAVFEQWAGGDPKHVPVVVRSAMRGIQEGFLEGQLG